jgi:uncharacterized DUF497 family protein
VRSRRVAVGCVAGYAQTGYITTRRTMEMTIVWSEYMKYRFSLRGYDSVVIEEILRYSSERYADTQTERMIAVGRHGNVLVMVPYEIKGNEIIPVTVHATDKKQITARLRSGRFRNA